MCCILLSRGNIKKQVLTPNSWTIFAEQFTGPHFAVFRLRRRRAVYPPLLDHFNRDLGTSRQMEHSHLHPAPTCRLPHFLHHPSQGH